MPWQLTLSMKTNHISKILSVWESDNKILQPIQKELHLDFIDQVASLFAIGNYYYYILNFENLEMEFVHEGITNVLGIEPSQFSIDTLFNVMHPDCLAKMHEKERVATDFLLKNIPSEEIPLYKVVYLMRLRHRNGSYKTILHQTKAINVSSDGKVQHVIGIHTDVSYLKMPMDNKISFISSERPSFYAIETRSDFHLINREIKRRLTKREKEIINKLAQGESPQDMAESLCISIHTVNTHKKNILKKMGCKNTPELIAKCLMEGII